jgi:hypothetical protein
LAASPKSCRSIYSFLAPFHFHEPQRRRQESGPTAAFRTFVACLTDKGVGGNEKGKSCSKLAKAPRWASRRRYHGQVLHCTALLCRGTCTVPYRRCGWTRRLTLPCAIALPAGIKSSHTSRQRRPGIELPTGHSTDSTLAIYQVDGRGWEKPGQSSACLGSNCLIPSLGASPR